MKNLIARRSRWNLARLAALVCCLAAPLASKEPDDPTRRAAVLAETARDKARTGPTAQALDLYREALALNPDDHVIRRDYAVVLGWAEHYAEASRQFAMVVEKVPDQPVWALREQARTELFGGRPQRALEILDQLIASGDVSEETRSRKGLTLRWLNRSSDAEMVYSSLIEAYPDSAAGAIGLANSLSDRNRLGDALWVVNRTLAANPGQWQLLQTKAQILNWQGRHLQAMKVLDGIPASHAAEKTVVETRIQALRWGGDPSGARKSLDQLRQMFPQNKEVDRTSRDLDLEYGYALRTTGWMIGDSDDFVDTAIGQEFAFHLNPAHRFQLGYQHRRFEQRETLQWRRTEAGWSGVLHRRVRAYASAAHIDYLGEGRPRRAIGDGGISLSLSDRVRLSAAGGSIAMDAFEAVRHQVTGSFYQGSLQIRPLPLTTLDGQWAAFSFNNGVRRQRVDITGVHRLRQGRRIHVDVGGRFNWMRHDRQTPDFFSPSSFQTHTALVRLSGRLSANLEYRTETAYGIQREPGAPLQHPLLLTGSLVWRLHPSFSLHLDAGRSTSSLDRINPGRPSYTRSFVVVGINFRND